MMMLHFVLYVRPRRGGEFARGPAAVAGIVGRPGPGHGGAAVFPSNARHPPAADTAPG